MGQKDQPVKIHVEEQLAARLSTFVLLMMRGVGSSEVWDDIDYDVSWRASEGIAQHLTSQMKQRSAERLTLVEEDLRTYHRVKNARIVVTVRRTDPPGKVVDIFAITVGEGRLALARVR